MDPVNILFLCTGNSARSIMAECILRARDSANYTAYSAGSNPKDAPHPMALRVLKEVLHVASTDVYSKHWDQYQSEDFDIVITVCDKARESCPVWPDHTVVAHWGFTDPAAFIGSEAETFQHFKTVAMEISRRIDLLLALPIENLKHYRNRFEQDVRRIGTHESNDIKST